MQLLLRLAVLLVVTCGIKAHTLKKFFKDQTNPWEDAAKAADEWPQYPYPDPFDKYAWHEKYHMHKPAGDPSKPMPKPWDADTWPMPKPWAGDWDTKPWSKPWVPTDPDDAKPAHTGTPIMTLEGTLKLFGSQGQTKDSSLYDMLKKLY